MAFHDVTEHTPEWHAMRLKHIGGSEIAALFGLESEEGEESGDSDIPAPFSDSLFSLHYIKNGTIKPRDIANERTDAGLFMEPSIASFAAAKRGWTIAEGPYVTDDTTRGMGASLDYIIEDAGKDAEGVAPDGRTVLRGIAGPLRGWGVLQIKNVALPQFYRKWVDGEPPLYVVLQVQHEIACAGFEWGVLAAWVGGNMLKLYFYEARPQIHALIRQKVADFWQRIRDSRPPAADGSDASAHALRELHPVLRNTEAEPLNLDSNNEVPELCAKLTATTKQRLELQKQEDQYLARIKQILGNATYAVCQAWRIKCSVTPANPGREPRPGELIGVRKETRRYYVSEVNENNGRKKKAGG